MHALNGGNGVVLEVELLQAGERNVPYLNECQWVQFADYFSSSTFAGPGSGYPIPRCPHSRSQPALPILHVKPTVLLIPELQSQK